jgi:hypothetical protein
MRSSRIRIAKIHRRSCPAVVRIRVNRNSSVRVLLRGAAIAAAAALACGTAAAQSGGLLDTLFGIFNPPPAASPVQPPLSPGIPSIIVTPRPSSGPAVAHCVRLCDGGHFPLPRLATAEASPDKLCAALCPGVRTRIYWGAAIDHAVASNGARYAGLGTAYNYRRARVEGCTCNGRDVFGTAAVSIAADVTLRRGDIVVTEDGLQVFVGTRAGTHQPADFTPVQDYPGLSPRARDELRNIRVEPRPSTAPKDMSFNARIIFGFEPLGTQFVPAEASPGR